MKKILNKLIGDIKRGDNLDVILALIVAILAFIVDISNTPISFISLNALIVTLLGILAFSLLKQRYLMEDSEKSRRYFDMVSTLKNEGIVNIRQTFSHSDLTDLLSNARKVKLLKTFFPANDDLERGLVNLLKNKAELTIYMLHPNSPILKARSKALNGPEFGKHQIIKGLKIINNAFEKGENVNCAVHFFECWPGSPIIIIDDKLYLGYYMISATSPYWPWVEVNSGSSFFIKLMDEFEKIERESVIESLKNAKDYKNFLSKLK